MAGTRSARPQKACVPADRDPPAAASSPPTTAHLGGDLLQPPVQQRHSHMPPLTTWPAAGLLHPCLPVTGLSTTMEILGEDRQRPVQKAKMEIVLHKSPDFHDIIAAEATAAAEAKAAEGEDS